jgi:hypothetical protein
MVYQRILILQKESINYHTIGEKVKPQSKGYGKVNNDGG